MRSLAEYEHHVYAFFNGLSRRYFETVDCPICGPQKKKNLFKITGKRYKTVVRCTGCDLIYLESQAKKYALEQFYTQSRALEDWSKIKAKQDQSYKYDKAINFLAKNVVYSLLDLGCGNGEFLRLAKERIGKIKLYGIEPNGTARKIASQYALVENTTVDRFFDTNETRNLDCISMWGVLEHLKNPLEALTECHTRLSENGYLIVCVPNVDSMAVLTLWDECFTFCPQHLWYFSIETLTKLVEMAGFEYETHWTIESEARAVLRKRMYNSPYSDRKVDEEEVDLLSETVLKNNMGYKIVAVFKK